MKQGWPILAILAICLSGCRKESDIVLATVGKESITTEDYLRKLQSTPVDYQKLVIISGGQRQFLDTLVREKLLVTYARKNGSEKSPDVQKTLDALRQEQAFQKKVFEERLLVQEALKALRQKELKITDAELQTYYETHRAEFAEPVEVRTSHILLSSEGDGLSALQRLKNGESFEKLARTISRDQGTAVRGGALKPFQPGQGEFVPEFEEAVKKLRVGETSGLVKTRFGFHIIRKTGERRLASRTFEQAKDDVSKVVEKEKFDQWIASQQKLVKQKVDDAMLANVVMPSAANPAEKKE